MSIKDFDAWFTHVDFFLSRINKLGNGPSIDVFSFECSDSQIVKGGGKTLYNLQNRHWYRGPVWFYDVDKVIHYHDAFQLEIHFSVRDATHHGKLHTQQVNWDLDKEAIVQPLYQDYKPRREAIEYMTSLGLPILEADRFFKAFSMAALHSTYVNNPHVLEFRKPINKGLFDRLVLSISKLPEVSKQFAEKFDLSADMLGIADQRLDLPDRDPEDLGNILVLLRVRADNSTMIIRW